MGEIYPSGRNIAVESLGQMLQSLRQSAERKAQSRREMLDWEQRMEARKATEAFRETSLEWQQAEAKERRETEGLRHKEAIDWRKQQATEAKEQRKETQERQKRLDDIKERRGEIVLEQQKKEWAAMPPEEKARMVKEKHDLEMQINREKLAEATGGPQGELIGGLLKDIRVRLEASGADEATIQAELTRAAGELAQMKPADLARLKEIRQPPIPVAPREATEAEIEQATREGKPALGPAIRSFGLETFGRALGPAAALWGATPAERKAMLGRIMGAPPRPTPLSEIPPEDIWPVGGAPGRPATAAPTARTRVERATGPGPLPAPTSGAKRSLKDFLAVKPEQMSAKAFKSWLGRVRESYEELGYEVTPEEVRRHFSGETTGAWQGSLR